MGFLINTLGKSLFTEESYKVALGKNSSDTIHGTQPGYACIVLQPAKLRAFGSKGKKEPAIIGLIKGQMTFNYMANWSQMGGFSDVMPSIPILGKTVAAGKAAVAGLSRISNFIGGADIGAVYASKLLYNKSGYLEISPSFRIVDWKGNGDPLAAGFLLASFCMPGDSASLEELIRAAIESMKGGDPKSLKARIGAFLEQGLGLAKEAVTNIQSNIEEFGGQVGANFYNNIAKELADDYTNIRSAPVPLKVTIGHYFYHKDMVLKNVSITYSKEMTRMGPLYADVQLALSSRKIMASTADIGLRQKSFRFLSVGIAGKGQGIQNTANLG